MFRLTQQEHLISIRSVRDKQVQLSVEGTKIIKTGAIGEDVVVRMGAETFQHAL